MATKKTNFYILAADVGTDILIEGTRLQLDCVIVSCEYRDGFNEVDLDLTDIMELP